MAKKPKDDPQAAPPPTLPPGLEGKLGALLSGGSTGAAEPPPEPEPPPAIVGKIVEEPAPAPDVERAFRPPTPEELAAFDPPPPIEAPPAPPSEPPLNTGPGTSVFPQAPMVMGDRSTHSGLVVGHVVPAPQVITPQPDVPRPPPKFEDLSEKTRAELQAGYIAHHGSLKGFELSMPDDGPKVTAPVVPLVMDEPVDTSKVSAKTRAEMEAGRSRLAQRNQDYRDVLARVAKNEAAKADEGTAPAPGNMDYTAR